MSDRPFAHLHCHSHYSLLDGAGSIKKLVSRAKAYGMNALALTDHGNLHGALEFYRTCRDEGVNPIIGYEAYIAPGSRFERGGGSSKDNSYHLTLLCQNRTGFRNLVKMASSASLEGFYFKPRIDKELLEAHHEGIICLSGCVSSEFNRAILKGQPNEEKHLAEAAEVAKWFHQLFGDRYFIEIMNNGVDIQRLALDGAVDLAKSLGLPLVATSDCHYVDQEDWAAQDVMLCINTGKFRSDAQRMKMDGREYHLRSPEEMYSKFVGLEDAVARSQAIADSVDIDLELGKRHFPVFNPPDDKTPDDYLRELCLKGLRERYDGDETMLPRWRAE
jgi:DNA polymerase III subunit alpha